MAARVGRRAVRLQLLRQAAVEHFIGRVTVVDAVAIDIAPGS